MRGPACIFWANLTPFSLEAVRAGGGDGEARVRVRPLRLMLNGPVLALTLCNFAQSWAACEPGAEGGAGILGGRRLSAVAN